MGNMRKSTIEPMEYPAAWLLSDDERLRTRMELQQNIAAYAAFSKRKQKQ